MPTPERSRRAHRRTAPERPAGALTSSARAQLALVALSDREILARAREIRAHRRAARREQRRRALAGAAAAWSPDCVTLAAHVAIHNRDARELSRFVTPDVALVFTSPPYNAGIEYATYDDRLGEAAYADLLLAVFRECARVMLDGARIGVVVPHGVGRDPWQPFAPRVQAWLVAAGFTLLGQVTWDKGEKIAAARTSWGSDRQASAPRLRDRTEAIVWAYKNVPALAIPPQYLLNDEAGTYTPFLAAGDLFRTLAQDVWCVSPDAASRAQHPAAFPVALAENAIRLFAYPGAHVLDPLMGIGSTLVAAKKLGCRATGVELDPGYCAYAQKRLEEPA